jgi:hypothetical protein
MDSCPRSDLPSLLLTLTGSNCSANICGLRNVKNEISPKKIKKTRISLSNVKHPKIYYLIKCFLQIL